MPWLAIIARMRSCGSVSRCFTSATDCAVIASRARVASMAALICSREGLACRLLRIAATHRLSVLPCSCVKRTCHGAPGTLILPRHRRPISRREDRHPSPACSAVFLPFLLASTVSL